MIFHKTTPNQTKPDRILTVTATPCQSGAVSNSNRRVSSTFHRAFIAGCSLVSYSGHFWEVLPLCKRYNVSIPDPTKRVPYPHTKFDNVASEYLTINKGLKTQETSFGVESYPHFWGCSQHMWSHTDRADWIQYFLGSNGNEEVLLTSDAV